MQSVVCRTTLRRNEKEGKTQEKEIALGDIHGEDKKRSEKQNSRLMRRRCEIPKSHRKESKYTETTKDEEMTRGRTQDHSY